MIHEALFSPSFPSARAHTFYAGVHTFSPFLPRYAPLAGYAGHRFEASLGAVMRVVSTDDVPVRDRFAYWHEVHEQLWAPYELRREPGSAFRAQVAVREFGPVQVTLMSTMPHTVHRSRAMIRRGDPEVGKLVCFIRGAGVVTHGDRCLRMGVGDLKLYDTSRPYQAVFAPELPVHQLLLLRFPRSSLPLPARDLRTVREALLPRAHGVGALASQFLLQLARQWNELTAADTARLATATLDVLTAALAGALDRRDALPEHTRSRALLAEIHTFIRTHLGEADLTPATIAAAHHISVRYLHKLFHEQGHPVGEWVRQQRLARCRRDLADPQLAARPIGTIATRWGFPSAAHFSQTFRTAYGESPRQFRERPGAVQSRPW